MKDRGGPALMRYDRCMDRALSRPALALHQLTLLALAGALLLTNFTGYAGVQILDHATATRIFSLHLHGVPGEAAYIHNHGAPAPFVSGHCHNALPDAGGQPAADEAQASTLAGATLCAESGATSMPLTHGWLATPTAAATPPDDLTTPPDSPPPQG